MPTQAESLRLRLLAKQLREDNISLSKVYSLVGGFFWIDEGGAIHKEISEDSVENLTESNQTMMPQIQ